MHLTSQKRKRATREKGEYDCSGSNASHSLGLVQKRDSEKQKETVKRH